jgi:DNA repair protein RadD
MNLRPYQDDVIADFERTVATGTNRVILVAATGAGKTIIGAAIIKKYVGRRKGVLVLAHRREIISQTSAKLHAHGIPHGIIQAGVEPRPFEAVQVASIQTLWMRVRNTIEDVASVPTPDSLKSNEQSALDEIFNQAAAFNRSKTELPPAELLVIDECHHAPARTYRKIVDAYPNATLLGLTATPCRGDGRGLGGIFDEIVECPQVADLIEQGYLVKTRVYAPGVPDLKGVRSLAGDYVESQLADRMDRPKLTGDIVTHWHKYGERRKTVCFAVNVKHSVHLRDEFIASGVKAEHIDGSTPKAERDASLARLASGEIEMVTNCMVLTEGWDMPEVSCCVLARPTKKMGLYRQMIGRVLRPAPGKPDAIILDHSGAVFRHGFAEDPVEWTLDPDTRAESPTHQHRLETHASRLLECSQCGAIRIAGEPCSNCGFLPAPPPRYVPIAAGDLGLVQGGRAKATVYDPAERMQWLAMLTTIGGERGYKPSWPAVNYKEKFGAWPPWGVMVEPTMPSLEVRSWVRSRMIAYAKRREAAA